MVLMIRTLTALLSIAVGVAIGALWFITARAIEPFHPADVRFYFNLYTEIGAASGFFSWYLATLVNNRRVHVGSACLILAIPFFLVLLLSLDNNPLTALAVIVLFTLAVIPSCVVAGKSRRQTCLVGEERPTCDGGSAKSPLDSRETKDNRR
jgi:hypothetical protein